MFKFSKINYGCFEAVKLAKHVLSSVRPCGHNLAENSIRRKTARTLLIKDYANSLTNNRITNPKKFQENFSQENLCPSFVN